ncbi:Peptidase C1-like family protein [Aspergillus parasiticus SU-1]|uniref:Cysteine proteinase 1, mitochondrial n=1 Tax=Aspergillus parasiticus (strain ATCC 56775 / NRRL 5862 / SRRC 143 / SU-1) TaxID=1403190 RepID=A0A0F0I2N2_ASPPU|nr:Peptidase C1-like family protein [Aspergillus parasiticus SU-1]
MGSNNSKLAPTNKKSNEKPAYATTATMKLKQIATGGGGGSLDTHVEHEAPPPYNAEDRAKSLAIPQLKDWEELLLSSDKNRLAILSFATNPYSQILANQSAVQAVDRPVFNVKIPLEGAPITNQRSSGRCWLFAATNVFRVPLMKKYNLKEFELSQAYLFYWDKIEKANWFMEKIIETTEEDLSSRLVQKLLEDPVTDGGQWDMVANLVGKYGLVPHDIYPDNFSAQNSAKMNWLVTVKLREHALTLRRLAQSQPERLARQKNEFLKEIHSLVTIMLGPPPSPKEAFHWEYYDADGKFQEVYDSPQGFARQASAQLARGDVDPRRMLSLVNDPRNEYSRLLTVDKLGNVVGGRPITYVNVDMKTIKAAAIAMLRAGHPVFFGCDVGKFYDAKLGVMDQWLLDLRLGFNTTLRMDKAQRLTTGESSMTHAMVLTGVHVEKGQPVRWRVQNSWGEAVGDKGWFVMADEWMDEFTYQVVVDSRFVSKEVRDILNQEPEVLPRWDPMGVLA